jgi:hypothetical protein
MLELIALVSIGGLVIVAVVFGARWLEMQHWRHTLVAYQLRLPSKLTIDEVARWLGMVAASTTAPRWSLLLDPPIGLEIVATARGIEHYLLVPRSAEATLLATIRAGLPGARLQAAPGFLAHTPGALVAAEVALTNHERPLAVDRAEAMSTALLASLQPLGRDEGLRFQILVTSAGTPEPVHTASPDPEDRWWSSYLLDDELPADAEAVRALRTKRAVPGLKTAMRLGIQASSRAAALRLFKRTWSTLHGQDAPGVRVVRRWLPSAVVATRLARRSLPSTAWLLLNTQELAGFVGFPLDGMSLAGLSTTASRQLAPPQAIPPYGTVVALSNYPGMPPRPLAISPIDRTRHLHVLGPIGVGKSTLIANMAIQDIQSGAGVVVIDPKNDLVSDVLQRIPAQRRSDVIVLDPAAQDQPVGFNLLGRMRSEAERELAVDHVVHIMSSIWRDSWGPRTSDVIRNSLLTLTHTTAPDGSAFTLVEVPELLNNPSFRRFVTGQKTVPATVRPFWHSYDQMSDGERANIIGAPMNKLRALTTRSALRLILGQSTGIDIGEVFRKRRILLVPLSKGLVGSDTAQLLGAFVVASLYKAALSRVAIPVEHRRPVLIHIDEFQDVIRLPVDIPDMLAQLRGLGAGLTLAHQYRGQLSEAVKTALGTVRSSMVFQLDYDDARAMEKRLAPLTADDLMNLPPFEVAMRLSAHGQTQRPVTGTTLPLPTPISDGNEVAAASRQQYGVPRAEVEAAIQARITPPGSAGNAGSGFGRRKRGGST